MPDVETIDPTLRRRAQGLLRDLTLLSYAPTQAWKTDAASHTRSRIACPSCRGSDEGCARCRNNHPPGTIVSEAQPHGSHKHHHESSGTSGPPHCDSLYEKFVNLASHHFHNNDAVKLEKLCAKMETELERYRGQHKAEIELPTDDKLAAAKVVRDFEDEGAIEVARRLLVPPEWVRGVRMRAPAQDPKLPRLDPETGKRYPGWRGWSDVQRIQEVRRCRRKGWLQEKVAAEFGVHSRIIRTVWQEAA